MRPFDIQVIEGRKDNLSKQLDDKLYAFALERLPNLPPESADRPFMIVANDVEVDGEAEAVAMLRANYYWDGLEIEALWVDQNSRREGLGARLLAQAEAYAKQLGAGISFLKTVDAKAFYEKQGYEVYGILEDRPIGTLLYHMKKPLA